MDCLSDTLLLDAYKQAKDLKLDPSFINLLEIEIYRRNLQQQLLTLTKTP